VVERQAASGEIGRSSIVRTSIPTPWRPDGEIPENQAMQTPTGLVTTGYNACRPMCQICLYSVDSFACKS